MSTRVAGEIFNFRPMAPAAPVPEVWRALDQAVARWVLAHGGSPALAAVAAWASYAEGQGDSALPLQGPLAGRHGMPVLAADELAQLAAAPMVATPADAMRDGSDAVTAPFVLDGGYFYLRRNFRHEVAVAAALNARRAAAAAPASVVTDADLDQLFHGPATAATGPQRDAVQRAVGRRLFVLTGGPGTGKTTTVLRMLLALGRDHQARHGTAPVVRISAPTGKAAQRLGESLRQGAQLLSGGGGLAAAWRPHLEDALRAEASTLHRLLGSRGLTGGVSHHSGNPVPADIVVVDEASMIDLALLRALLDALAPETVLVLVGDADQLTSVGTGSVLLDLVSAMEEDGGGDLVRLHHCFRADTALVAVNEAVRRGDPGAFAQAAADAGSAHFEFRAVHTPHALAVRLSAWADRLHAGLEAAVAFEALPEGVERQAAVLGALAALREQQLLCALREGGFGALEVNAQLEALLRTRLGVPADTTWYPGRAVMVTRNDYATDLFNGDVGLCLADAAGNLQVWFETAPDAAAAGTPRVRALAPGSLPAHQGAFAVTVHKSQGSEYGDVAVLLPPHAGNAVLSRQLLYTGLTRARRQVQLWATPEVVAAALEATVNRSAALRARLQARGTASD